jgi:transposase
MGRLAKTGRIDAQMLAELTAVLVRRADLARFLRPLSDEQQLLAALVTRRRQLQTMLTSERQRLQIALPKVRPSIEAMIQTIRAQLDEVEGQMLNHCANTSPNWTASCARPPGSSQSPAPTGTAQPAAHLRSRRHRANG